MSAPSVNSVPNETTANAGEHRSPLAFIIDEEANIRQFVSLILQGGGVDTIEFVDGPSFRETPITRAPDLVFLNVNLEAQDAVQSIETLSKSDFAGAVQLIAAPPSSIRSSKPAN
jgi:DNA-binding response OmpR family regulator